jgi:hypothetical protein
LGLQAAIIAEGTGGLLHHPFTLTSCEAVYFLLHFPSAFAGHPLDGTLSYGSPDFPLVVGQAATCCTEEMIVKLSEKGD